MSLLEVNDQIYRQEALDPTQSFIVQAPAGSGKTGLLTQRFLVLLGRADKNPEECLGITFTRKAASEMKDRILSALERAKDDTPPDNAFERQTWDLARIVLNRDRALNWDLLLNPSRLKIQTIDSLCASLTRQLPILAQFGSPPQVVEDARPYYAKAARALLASLESDEAWRDQVENLLKHLDNNLTLTERLLIEMLQKRDQWLPHIGRTFHQTEVRSILESGLRAIYEESLTVLEDEAIHLGELYKNLLKIGQGAALELERQNSVSVIRCLSKTLISTSKAQISTKDHWQGIAELIFTKDFSLRKSLTKNLGFPAPGDAINKEDKLYYKATKDSFLGLLTELEEHPKFLAALKNFIACPPCEYSDMQWEILQSLMTLLPILVAELSIVFQSEGVADFVEIGLGALRALGHYDHISDLALSLDYKIQHILIDEFQDTSISQWRLLEKLVAGWQPNDNRTLFLVGDPMQSIYRFRQAEVGLFIKAKQFGIGGTPLKSLTLTTNFRSDPNIISWVNHFFNPLFPKMDDIQSGAITFHPCLAAKSSIDNAYVITENFSKKKIEKNNQIEQADQHTGNDLKKENDLIELKEEGEGEGVSKTEAEQEALKIVDFIHQIKNDSPTENIAILVRSRSHLKEILPALKAANIPYQGIQLESLAQRPLIQDLLVLTRALCHLGDRVAWLALLRSPWCHLNLSDIWLIAKEAKNSQTIWSVLKPFIFVEKKENKKKSENEQVKNILDTNIENSCQDDFDNSKLPDISEKEKLMPFITILDKALFEKGRLTLRDWIEKTWLNLLGEKHLYTEQCLDDLNVFLSLLEEEQSNHIDVDSLEKKLNMKFVQTKQIDMQSNPVHIMTMHKSKGLEFDTVIVPGIGRRSQPDGDKLLWWAERPKNTALTDPEREEDAYLLLAPIRARGSEPDPVYLYLKKQESLRSEYESMRLLYVAATRARKRLLWLTHE